MPVMTDTVLITMQIITLFLTTIQWIYVTLEACTSMGDALHESDTELFLQHCWSNAYIKIWTKYSETSILHPLNLRFPSIYNINLLSLMKGHTISVKISLNLYVLTFAFSTIVHSNFEVSPAETPSILCAFPFVKFSTDKYYDWSNEISQ
jgi:hypothetical protein